MPTMTVFVGSHQTNNNNNQNKKIKIKYRQPTQLRHRELLFGTRDFLIPFMKE